MLSLPRAYRIALALLALLTLSAVPAAARPRYAVITLLHTNDMHGHVLPKDGKGGLARVATLVRQVRADMPNVLLLDAGDFAHGSPEEYFFGGKAIVSAMNAMSYSAAAPGNHDFDLGSENLKSDVALACFPLLAANVRAAAGGEWDGAKPYQVFELSEARIGVIGLTVREPLITHWPGWMRDVVIEDPVMTAQALVPEVRKLADVVIVLSHLGQEADAALAKAVGGIDFIIGGHSHTPIIGWKRVNGTHIAQSYPYAQGMGRIDFIVRLMEHGARIVSVNGRDGNWNALPRPPLGKTYPTLPLIPANQTVPEDACVRDAYMPYRTEADARLAEVIGSASTDIPARRPGYEETPAGNLVADAVREYAKADVAVIDAKSVVTGVPKGVVTVGTVFNLIHGFTGQHIVTAAMTGADLQLALQKRFSGKEPMRAQVSGASLDYTRCGETATIGKILVNDQPLDATRVYTVAAQAYVMMEMMQTAPSAKVLAEPCVTTREAVADYIRSRGTIGQPSAKRSQLHL